MGVVIPQVVSEDRAGGAQIIDGGLRFDNNKAQYLTRTPASAGNRTTYTLSFWFKKQQSSATLDYVFGASSDGFNVNYSGIFLATSFELQEVAAGSVTARKTAAPAIRDHSGWYHLVIVWDTNNGTADDRYKFYLNGTRILTFTPHNINPSSGLQSFVNSTNPHYFSYTSSTYSTSCLLSQVYFIDGQALDVSYFGYTDPLTNVWRPKRLDITKTPSASYGTNGYYLPFDGSAPIGQDQSGRGNNWTPVNFGNYATLDKATGALPILNTDGGGKVARVGVRTDNNPVGVNTFCTLALPLVGIKSDFSNQVSGGISNNKAVTVTSATASNAQSNFYGGSFNFTSSSTSTSQQYLDVKPFITATQSWTLEFWFYRTQYTNNFAYIFTDDTSGALAGGEDTTGRIYFGRDWFTAQTSLTPSTPLNTWTHFAISVSNGTATQYLNGVAVTTDSNMGITVTPSVDMRIGAQPIRDFGSNGRQFFGYLQDIRFYNGVAKYTSNFIPASTDPDIVPDSPSGVSYSSNVALVPSTDGAVAFDGSGDYLSINDNADFDFGTGDYTIEAFLYVNAFGGSGGSAMRYYAQSTGAGGGGNGLSLTIDDSGYVRPDANTSTILTAATPLTLKKWTHVAVSRSSGTMRLFLDGVLDKSASDTSNISSSSNVLIGAEVTGGGYFNGFISNFHVVKGTALYTANFTPPSAPISSVANTKLLCCKSNSSATAADVTPGTITANGNAAASNFNPFTVNINTQRGKQSGYATLNPLDNGGLTLSSGNLYASRTTTSWVTTRADVPMSSGKWYMESVGGGTGGSVDLMIGVCKSSATLSNYVGSDTNGWGYVGNSANKYTNSTATSYGTGYQSNGDIVGVAFDADAGTLTFYKNGISQGVAFSGLTSGPYFFAISIYGATNFNCNFGQKPFKFPPPAGFQPLTLANTPRPTVVRPDQYVGIVTYTGNGGTQSLNYGFKPDFVWIKNRDSGSYGHRLVDSVRGASLYLMSHNTGSESTAADGITSFNSNGVSLGSNSDYNLNTNRHVAWAWKAGGNSNTFNINDVGYSTASAAGLTAGTITPTGASVNTKTGFSIIKYSHTINSPQTIAHGLTKVPEFIIAKFLDGTTNWNVYHASGSGAGGGPQTGRLILNSTVAYSDELDVWNDTAPTNQVWTVGGSTWQGSGNHITYLWHSVPGFSRFGSFTGNGSADGPVVITGFSPRWLLIKRTDASNDWWMWDTARSNTGNPVDEWLSPNRADAEYADDADFDFLSNGFKIRNISSTVNASGGTYIYAAFAEAPTFNLYGAQANAR